ncbi:MAG: MBL fold metallo-hydrolase [Saprospiraceae bacterium]|nr:MBL fold metallo-hydrolase [Saprospiraceae bacterium]
MKIKTFVFNPFQENTFILYDQNGDCAIIDPGCNSENENSILSAFIESNGLIPVYLLLTHAHIDHILGVNFVSEKYKLVPYLHPADLFLFTSGISVAEMYGLDFTPPPVVTREINDNSVFTLGESKLTSIHCPGHSPGGVCFYSESDNLLISGDVLFNSSIGRTDLPGGNYKQLIESIQSKLMILPDETIVHPGHSEFTTIGEERLNNPFL